MRGNGDGRRETRIGCADLAGHPHELIVVDDPVGLVLVFPPDAWAVFTRGQVGQLRARFGRTGPW